MTTTIRQYCAALRKDGFALRYRDRHRDGNVTEFYKRDHNHEVSVQLWEHGDHRASLMMRVNNDDTRWRGTTHPTDFNTLEGMTAAIAHEFSRAV